MKLGYGVVLAAGALLTAAMAGCTNNDPTTTATSTTSAHATTTSAAATTTATPAVKLIEPSHAPLPAPSPTHPPAPAPAPLADIDCGPITGANGATAQPDATTPSMCAKDGLVIGLRADRTSQDDESGSATVPDARSPSMPLREYEIRAPCRPLFD